MDLEGIMLSEVSQGIERQILYDLMYMWNLNMKHIKRQKAGLKNPAYFIF